ncbi:MAG TPA: hypothetical protein VGC15_16690 [Acetobacteraceae bacterium]
MSDVQSAALVAESREAPHRLTELRVSASMMQLDAGLYCIVVTPSSAADANTGLPGLRITPAPGPAGRPDAVRVRTLSDDGWMTGFGDAALVRVTGGPAFVLVTVYQAPGSTAEGAPALQVLPLIGEAATAQLPPPAAAPAPAPTAPRAVDMVAHIQTRGDVGERFGEWVGERGSGKWIEGFGIAPTSGVALADIEYQVVLGRGWLSPWVEGGQYCGSRGMALPILGLRVRLRGAAAEAFELRYSASFIDGTSAGPVAGGEPCESESLAAVEAMLIEVAPIGTFARTDAAAAKPKRTAKAKRS